MVMADEHTGQDEEYGSAVPLDEVIGEAEAKFGPIPTCIRSLLLPSKPSPKQNEPLPVDTFVGIPLGSADERESGEPDSSNKVEVGLRDKGNEGGISLDDIQLVPSTSEINDVSEFHGMTNGLLVDLDGGDESDGDENARRSPDSGCSMSEASAEDKVSIASSVSSSEDYGMSNLEKKVQQLRKAMNELREMDVALARQLFIVYDYVEETKWFLENFETCDPRHSVTGVMTPSERRFSLKMHKRLSDFGITYLKGISPAGFNTPPSWTELSGTTTKRHSRNISDGSITIEHLRKIYHENINNSGALPKIDTYDVDNGKQSGRNSFTSDSITFDHVAASDISMKQRPHGSMTRRSISLNYLEISLSLTPESENVKIVNENVMSSITDVDKVRSNCHNEGGLSSFLQEADIGEPITNDDSDRTSVNASITGITPDASLRYTSTPIHHQHNAATTSPTFSSEVDTSVGNITKPASLPLLSRPDSLYPTAADCSIFIADESDDVAIMSPYEYHLTWLQEQDETLL